MEAVSEYIDIQGGYPLHGELHVSGAKNAALPILIASLLTSEACTFRNVPNLEDTHLTLGLLKLFGAETEFFRGEAKVHIPQLVATEASYSLVKSLRASFWVLGPLLARGRAARVALPGGDMIGARPVDMHLEALVKMGADIHVKHGVVYALAPQGLRPARIHFRFPSVGATHQVLMAAARTPGETIIEGAACEPEVFALGEFLNQLGAQVEGHGSSSILIRGQDQLGSADCTLIGDRIEAATYLLAAVACGGDVHVRGIQPAFFGDFLGILSDLGVFVECTESSVRVRRTGDLRSLRVATGPFPEFATDMQAPLMAALCFAQGESEIEETVFEARFGHVAELCRMGAKIQVEGNLARISGSSQLMNGAEVEARDIRAGAALVIAGLASQGRTAVLEPQHLRRGYSFLEEKFRLLGARIGKRMHDPEDFLVTGC